MRYLYVIKGGSDRYKIGIAANTNQRLRELQTGNGDKLAIICTRLFDNAEEVEATLHSMLQKYLGTGGQEWFILQPEQVIKVLKIIHEFKDIHVTDQYLMLKNISSRYRLVMEDLEEFVENYEDIKKMKKLAERMRKEGEKDNDVKPAGRVKTVEEIELEDEVTLKWAREVILKKGKASTSLLQREMRIGYSKAARVIDLLEEAGFISPPDGMRPRSVYVDQTSATA